MHLSFNKGKGEDRRLWVQTVNKEVFDNTQTSTANQIGLYYQWGPTQIPHVESHLQEVEPQNSYNLNQTGKIHGPIHGEYLQIMFGVISIWLLCAG